MFALKQPTFRYNEYNNSGTDHALMTIWVDSSPRFRIGDYRLYVHDWICRSGQDKADRDMIACC